MLMVKKQSGKVSKLPTHKAIYINKLGVLNKAKYKAKLKVLKSKLTVHFLHKMLGGK